MKKLIQLKTEKDFAKIGHLPFNREFSVRNDLIESMNIYGFMDPVLILNTDIMDGKKRMWLLDGQHRMITAQFLKIPVDAVVIESDAIKNKEDLVQFIAFLNSKTKQWRMINYVEAFNYLGYSEYDKLLKLTNSVPYSVNTVATLLSGTRGKKLNTKSVHEGNFHVRDYDGTVECLEFAASLSKYQKLSSRMLIALKGVMGIKSFNKTIFEKKYRENAKIIKEMNLDDYSDVFLSWCQTKK